MLANHPDSLTIFKDDDDGFHDWLGDYPGGYFINCDRKPKANYLVLHRPSCPHFDRSPSVHWPKDYIKICSTSRGDLEEWAAGIIGGEVTFCSRCFG